MAFDKVIDSAQLDADLTSVADAIRERAGTTGKLAFPAGYVEAVEPLVNAGDRLAAIVNKTVSEMISDGVITVGTDFQAGNPNLHTVDLPNCTTTSTGVFMNCTNLSKINMPSLKTVGGSSFRGLPALESIYLPEYTTTTNWGYVFYGNSNMVKAYFPKLTSIWAGCFGTCNSLKTLVLGSETVCELAETGALAQTQIAWGSGYVYVPSALVDSYKAATNWSTYAAQIRAIEDYPEVLEGW